jgi:glycosyltransferase involved in cell wall biosynthesis
MRALHVNSGNMYGGVETMLATLARHQHLCPELEHQFALCFAGRLGEELTAAGARVHPLGGVRSSRPLSVLRGRRALSQVLEQGRFDAVICHSSWPQAIFGPVARRAGVPLVYWLHGAMERLTWLDRWAQRTAPDLAICNSQFTARSLPNIYPQVEQEVIYCPVAPPTRAYSPDERRELRRELDTPEDAVVIIQASRMEAWKGHLLHLAALSRLRDLPNWVCWIVGGAQRPSEERYLSKVKDAAAQLGIADRVRFLGQRSDVPRLLAAVDVHCQPNAAPEPFGIAFIEALQARLPVVTFAFGGALEIVNEQSGKLVNPGDTTSLARELKHLIVSREARQLLAQGAAARANEICQPRRQMKRLAELLTGFAKVVAKERRIA